MSQHRIEKRIVLTAPLSKVWRALTDYQQFGAWFGVKLESPFMPGQISRGKITHPGYEHLSMEIAIQKIEPERLFSYEWHPYAIDPSVDYSSEPMTLVEFHLEPTETGTLLIVTESGFEQIPAARRDEAFRKNEGGWAQQMKQIEKYVADKP